MGIVNVTPDSFSDGGAFLRRERAVEHALRLIDEGAELLDIGGESTRPGALPVSAEEERERVIPVIQDLVDRGVSVPISVDTYKASVADTALQEGADVVNDISMLRFDPQLADVVAAHGAYMMLMHSRHVPQDMQKQPHYHSLWGELLGELEDAISSAVGAGVSREHIAVDPGIGFGKRQIDNLRILRELPVLRSFGLPVVVGASRKSFIGRILDEPATQRLEGSLAAAAVSSIHGAHFIRVHDVAETSKLLRVLEAIRRPIFQ
ncbi:MAG TPA: dihydropteroate synthase [Myxococcales bacterium]|nr:dihydropteroate synthase [Deltaproteobacteria bacterium]MBU48311.1 dihydropteroate synthase [Deltaproteobacteria bacterium]HAA56406.1 dihydropteroate synthase [Myxococcales bacterium]|tara:strand:+ start:9478 stop:10269 length:792 start_codon:yes stop_codon:yes gene_type:complete